MKSRLLSFLCIFAIGTHACNAAAIRKAAPVAQKETSAASTGSSLLPTVLGLVGNIQQLNAKTKALSAECVPSAAEITFVNKTMQEWAKTGATSAKEIKNTLRREPCRITSGGYAQSVEVAAATNDYSDICYDTFATASDQGMVWAGFPKVGSASYCEDGSPTCAASAKKTSSDIYEIFNLIDFSEADYTVNEATMAAKLLAKIENCSDAKLSAKKRELWGEFLTGTLGGLGQSTSTGAIMEQVGGLTGGGGLSGMSSLGGFVNQIMDR